MPETNIEIGGREFSVSCRDGEEHYLQSAANILDGEAAVLISQIGRMPENRMLLMAGLMLADKTAGLEEKLREAEAKVGAQQAQIKEFRDAPKREPERIEVAVIPPVVSDTFAEIAARSEALADKLEERLRANLAN